MSISQCTNCFFIIVICWWNSCYHCCFCISTKWILQQSC